ncbi:hypothetical protein PGT21_023096 [Puccinia graminis f. sp. tritici]|uniref:RING-type domain-containing protein n=1 Tax=Puccinia graminis f. sp. tritici TaxID=56615 RepID=A0A5B0PJW1_PUCGR|nr:hypothetical protein PGT21_023096 [Puccinia graminis f. sp. tritici]KAA1100788.1 hypothetical protein PGTUg99_027213 [Puccinia graminis f. sp. tritici]
MVNIWILIVIAQAAIFLAANPMNLRHYSNPTRASFNPRGIQQGGSCSICFQDLEDSNIETWEGCNHNFCQDCTSRWKEEAPTCPICRNVDTRLSSYHTQQQQPVVPIPVLRGTLLEAIHTARIDLLHLPEELKDAVRQRISSLSAALQELNRRNP